tara:strand:- start:97 stop:639 length:543 start_codon:yes stop_codon:yes gene_type:complete
MRSHLIHSFDFALDTEARGVVTERLPDMPRTESDEALAVLLRLKDQLGLTAEDIADRFGWSKQYTSGMLNGTYPPRFEILRFLYQQTFDADLARVMFGADIIYTPAQHEFRDGHCGLVVHELATQMDRTTNTLVDVTFGKRPDYHAVREINAMMSMLASARRDLMAGKITGPSERVDEAV